MDGLTLVDLLIALLLQLAAFTVVGDTLRRQRRQREQRRQLSQRLAKLTEPQRRHGFDPLGPYDTLHEAVTAGWDMSDPFDR